MRKHILLSAAALLSATGLFAQAKKQTNTFASHISLGPVVSVGHSWVSNVPGHRDFKFSPAAGIGLVYSKNVHWGLGTQLLVSHEGFKQETPVSPTENMDMTVNPVYLRLPLQAIYFFGEYGDRVRPKIYAGPSVALKVDETRHYNDDRYRPADGTPAAADLFSRADFGLTAGVGANMRLHKATWLNFDAGYYHGLVDVISATNSTGFNGNRNLRLNVGLMWGL